MNRLLFVVEETVEIPDRGFVAVPGIVPERDECFRTGDRLRVQRPYGSTLHTSIASLELVTPNPNHAVVVMFPGCVSKSDVPAGSEVWSDVDHR